MSDAGHNTNAVLTDIADGIAETLDEIAELQADVKQRFDDAKNDGWDVKVLKKIIKEKRGGADYQAECLEAEEVLDTYRRGIGLPTTLEAAQAAARTAAASTPEPKQRRTRKDLEG